MPLDPKRDTDDIAEAIRKVQAHIERLGRTDTA
jgi:hypothetical protein